MREGILNLAREICGIAKLKEDQVTIAEIVLNSFGPGSDDRLAQGKILKDACWRVNLSEDIFLVRYNAEVAGSNCFYDSI